MEAKLKYPVFVFLKKDNMVYVDYRDKDMKATNTEIFNTTNFKGRIIIDSSGTKYVTRKAYQTGYLGIKGFSLFMVGKAISFEYDYENEVVKISLEELKEMIINRYPKSRWFYSAWVDVEEFKEEMDKCTTFEELARVVGDPPPSSNFFLRLIRGY